MNKPSLPDQNSSLVRLTSSLKRLSQCWVKHDNSRSAAAISFYAIFTIAPMLVFATAGLGLLVGDQQAQSLTEQQLEKTMGSSGARIAHEVLAHADFSRHSVTSTAVSLGLLLYGASAMFFQLRQSLNRIFGSPQRTVRAAVIDTILGRLIAVCCVIIAASLLVATLITQVVLHSASQTPLAKLAIPEPLWQLASAVTTAVIVLILIMALLKLLPSQPPTWRPVLRGAAVTVVLFELARWLISLYISRSVVASAYGPSSAMVAFVLWVYFSAMFFILGAEVCQLSRESESKI